MIVFYSLASGHSPKKRKNSLEAQGVLLIFSIELEISEVSVKIMHQNSETVGFCAELFRKNDFQVVLATFCCYDCGANASEAVQKIATDQKGYHKCSSFVIVC